MISNVPAVCRLCLYIFVSSSQSYCLITDESCSTEVSLDSKLKACFPELDFSVVPIAALCRNCFENVGNMYNLLTKCQQFEKHGDLSASTSVSTSVSKKNYPKICTFCLATNVTIVQDTHLTKAGSKNEELSFYSKLNYCFPGREYNFTTPLVLCKICINNLNGIYMFKSQCLQVNQYIMEHLSNIYWVRFPDTSIASNRSRILKLHRKESETQEEYSVRRFTSNLSASEYCRICLKQLEDETLRFPVNYTSKGSQITARDKLVLCLEEVDVDAIPGSVLCNTCLESIDYMYGFRSKYIKKMIQICINMDMYGHFKNDDRLIDLSKTCVTCFKKVTVVSFKHSINTLDDTEKVSIYDKLRIFCPDMDTRIVKLAIVCSECYKQIEIIFSFIEQCHQNDYELQQHLNEFKYEFDFNDTTSLRNPFRKSMDLNIDEDNPKETSLNATVNVETDDNTPKTSKTKSKFYKCGHCQFVAVNKSVLKLHFQNLHWRATVDSPKTLLNENLEELED